MKEGTRGKDEKRISLSSFGQHIKRKKERKKKNKGHQVKKEVERGSSW
jgi:hypothetical protein